MVKFADPKVKVPELVMLPVTAIFPAVCVIVPLLLNVPVTDIPPVEPLP